MDYNLAFIPKEFNVPMKTEFDTTYMRQLFEYGRQLAAGGLSLVEVSAGLRPHGRRGRTMIAAPLTNGRAG